MAMRAAADVFNYPKQQNVIRSGTCSDDSCSTQSEGYSPPLPLYVQGPKTRCVSVAGRLQLREIQPPLAGEEATMDLAQMKMPATYDGYGPKKRKRSNTDNFQFDNNRC
ncbi:uncharacterized protein [Littorina saxatilis]|uniref:uncharacterized protein n=1 Tax=Littorina saxatilis TaxID=31220 RepID=UPI0038B59157